MKFLVAAICLAFVATSALAQVSPCLFSGVSDSASCMDQCTNFQGADSGSYSNGVCSCTTNSTTEVICNNDDPTDYILALLNQFAPAACQGIFSNIINGGLIECFTSSDAIFTEIDNIFNFEQEFDSNICDNMCLSSILGAAVAFTETQDGMMCSEYLAMLNGGDDDDDSAGATFNVTVLNELRGRLNVYCTEGGMGYCGDIAGVIAQVFEDDAVSAENCTLINNRGFCLGNVEAYVNMNPFPYGEGSYLNGSSLVDTLNWQCMNQSVDITAASSATESPADISSGSFVSGSILAIVAVTLAAIFFKQTEQ